MMRSLFSGVAGLKTHQTRMDVIGNNIANVNTTAYKSQSMVFNDLLYQTTQAASGANAATGRGGINARQIGLGSRTGAIKTAITQQGSAQSTNDPFDIMITGDAFFIVSNGSSNFFTRDGSFTVDGAGNLVMTSTGYTVMGWQVDADGNVVADTVSALRVMDERNLTYPAESTTRAYFTGIVDENDTNVNSEAGRIVTLSFFDRRGYSYTAKFSIHSTDAQGNYTVQLDDILDSTGVSLVKRYGLSNIKEIANFGRDLSFSTTKMYTLDEETFKNLKVVYKQENGADTDIVDHYKKTFQLKDILTGGDFTLVNKATTLYAVEVADDGTRTPLDVKDFEEGDPITVYGETPISNGDLAEEPYNISYDADTQKYYGMDEEGNRIELPLNDHEAWEKALHKLGKGNKIVDVKLNDTGDGLILGFTSEFKTNREVTSENSTSFTGDITILEAFGFEENSGYEVAYTTPSGKQAQITKTVNREGNPLVFDAGDGEFSYVGNPDNDSVLLTFNASATSINGQTIDLSMFTDIDIDFSALSNQDNGGICTTEATNGMLGNPTIGAGRRLGEMIGIEVGQDGIITASYDNGQTKTLGQIAVAVFANASGLAKEGDNLYSATMNSGEFDGVGQDITADGAGYMTSGVLEMSNVDLSQEFTEMITTQRGFQANSRIITVSDTLLEELVNLKR